MQRTIPEAARASSIQQSSPDAWLGFVTITHPNLSVPVRIVSDPVDYLIDGNTFTGIVFDFRILTDNDSAPRGQLTVPNVDRRILRALLEATGRAKVELAVLTSADFDLAVRPRTAIGTPVPIYRFHSYELVDVQADAIQLSATIMLRDYSQEPWPSVSASQSRLPGLFRV